MDIRTIKLLIFLIMEVLIAVSTKTVTEEGECCTAILAKCQICKIKQRRYDISDLGYAQHLHGWFDVQGQGAANDYCRFVGNSPNIFLSCALAGTHGESEMNYNSAEGIDIGYTGTSYMKDEDGDGRDDYCRCIGVDTTERISCTKAGPKGFFGSPEQNGNTDSFSPTGYFPCASRKVRPEFGKP